MNQTGLPDFAKRWADLLQSIRNDALDQDRRGGSLADAVELLREAGWLRACLPTERGGEGWGSDAAGTDAALFALQSLGSVNLSVGRLFEGHMNAVKLMAVHGSR